MVMNFVVCNKTNSGHHQALSVVNFIRDTILYSKHWNFSYSTIGAIMPYCHFLMVQDGCGQLVL